jgi:hypothetical protein
MATYVIFVKASWCNGLWFSATFLLHAIMAGGCRHSQSAKCRSPQFHVGLFICYFEHSTWVRVTVIVMLWTVCVLRDCVWNKIAIEAFLLFTGRDFLCPLTLQTDFMEHSSSWLADGSSPGLITWEFLNKNLPLDPVLSQISQIRNLTPFCLKVLNNCCHTYLQVSYMLFYPSRLLTQMLYSVLTSHICPAVWSFLFWLLQ